MRPDPQAVLDALAALDALRAKSGVDGPADIVASELRYLLIDYSVVTLQNAVDACPRVVTLQSLATKFNDAIARVRDVMDKDLNTPADVKTDVLAAAEVKP